MTYFLRTLLNSFFPICLLLATVQIRFVEAIAYPDFEVSMLRIDSKDPNRHHLLQEREMLYNMRNQQLIALFRKIYEDHVANVSSYKAEKENRIPRIIHQIWLGSEVPEELKAWMQTWQNLNGWKYMLWTDTEAEQFTMHNQDLYDNAKNFAEKSDILRLEVLHRYGGLYVDTDCQCLKPEIFEELHHCFDFYAGFEPLEHGSVGRFNMFQVCNAVIGSIPYHPLLKECITNLNANYLAYKKSAGTCHRTGPSYLTRIICAYEKGDGYNNRNIYLPSTFFYSFSEPQLLSEDTNLGMPEFLETASHHWWHGTWRKNVQQAYGKRYGQQAYGKRYGQQAYEKKYGRMKNDSL